MTRKPSGPVGQPLAPAGAAAIAHRAAGRRVPAPGRVGPHGQVLAQQGGGDGAIGELHCRRCRCPRRPLLESIL